MPKDVLLIGVKFAQYGNSVVTATYKLANLLACSGARVFVTSITTDEEEQEKELDLAKEVTRRANKESGAEDISDYESCTAKEKQILDLLKDKPLATKTLDIAKAVGLKTAKEVNPILYPLQRRKLIEKCAESPVTWKLCAIKGGVEVIFPLPKKAQREGNPSHHWVSQLHGTFYDFHRDSKYDHVEHIIGFVPTTAKAAVEIRNQWRDTNKRKDGDVQVTLVNVGHVREENNEELSTEMCEWVKQAQHVFSFGPKLFQHYSDVYRGAFGNSLGAEHKMLMLFPDLLDSSESWNKSQVTKLVTFCAQDLPTHEKEGAVAESVTDDFRIVCSCLHNLAQMHGMLSEDKPQWQLCALKDVEKGDHKLQQMREGMEDGLPIQKMSTVTSQQQLLRRLRSCTAVVAPEAELDSFNFLVWEAIGFAVPVLATNECGVAKLLETELCCPQSIRCVVRLQGGSSDSARWKESLLQNVLNRSAQPEVWAKQLRDSIRNHDVIKKAVSGFLSTFGLAVPAQAPDVVYSQNMTPQSLPQILSQQSAQSAAGSAGNIAMGPSHNPQLQTDAVSGYQFAYSEQPRESRELYTLNQQDSQSASQHHQSSQFHSQHPYSASSPPPSVLPHSQSLQYGPISVGSVGAPPDYTLQHDQRAGMLPHGPVLGNQPHGSISIGASPMQQVSSGQPALPNSPEAFYQSQSMMPQGVDQQPVQGAVGGVERSPSDQFDSGISNTTPSTPIQQSGRMSGPPQTGASAKGPALHHQMEQLRLGPPSLLPSFDGMQTFPKDQHQTNVQYRIPPESPQSTGIRQDGPQSTGIPQDGPPSTGIPLDRPPSWGNVQDVPQNQQFVQQALALPYGTSTTINPSYRQQFQGRQQQQNYMAGYPSGAGFPGEQQWQQNAAPPPLQQQIPKTPLEMQPPWGDPFLFQVADVITDKEKLTAVGLTLGVDSNTIERNISDEDKIKMQAYKVLQAFDAKSTDLEQEKRKKLRLALFNIGKGKYIHDLGL